MSASLKFGLYNALMGLAVGIYIAYTATGSGYELFAVIAPVAVFMAGWLFWKWLIKSPVSNSRVLLVGLLTGSVSHYIAFVLLSVVMNICYWTTGGCTGSLGDAPAGIIDMLWAGFAYSFFSLIAFGWVTVPLSMAIGFWVNSSKK